MMWDNATHFFWIKGGDHMLSRSFRTTEHSCHCADIACHVQTISKDLVRKNQDIRDALGAPITVTSGFRCHVYQLHLAATGHETAKGTSQHELGNATDLAASDMHKLQCLCEKSYSAVGVARSFIHVDLREPHADGSPRRWEYK